MSNTDRVRPPVPLNLADAYLLGEPAPTDDQYVIQNPPPREV